MNELSRKTKYQSNQESVMQSSKNFYSFKGFSIDVLNYNKNYFESSKQLLEAYTLVFADYFEKSIINAISFIDFLKDSVENNYMLCDIIRECDFSIKDEHILFQDTDSTDMDLINMGQFIFRNCKINVCGSYMFIEDLTTNIKYFYYGD
ncbi:MAG: hypothetical protein L3J10_05090 [Sulfurimonas sp.]|nr:hypothetical protein [Sulfurimonas sp.]